MPSVQIGKYKRPGIFIEEFDRSVIDTPTITGLQTLVIGSSKKGPVNTPVQLSSQTDLNKVFGDLDRSLESKGSYFHRTISKILESSPVVAINLLNPDDDLDTLEYKSLSSAAGYDNDIDRDGSYRRFFDTSSFWKKDREAFLAIASDNPNDSQRVLHLTNYADRQITVFIVKSVSTGFDRTLLEWYGSVDKVPYYVDPKDYASDYLVDVIVVGGDYTDYANLAIDPIFGEYFSPEGIVKSELFNFSEDRNVNTLYVWRGLSLIPYFRDSNKANIFIENKINEQTNTTGLWCAFDIDAVETDYRNGLLDILGNSIINDNTVETIDFLSYQADITELNNYPQTNLDTLTNVYQMPYDNYYQDPASQERTALYAEGFINGLVGPTASELDGFGGTTSGTFSMTYTIGATISGGFETNPYVVIGGAALNVDTTTFSYTGNDFVMSSGTPGATQTFTKVLFIDSDGGIKDDPTSSQLSSGIVLGYTDFVIAKGGTQGIPSTDNWIESVDYTPVSVDDSGFIYFDVLTGVTFSYNTNADAITYEFLNTTGTADVTDYVTYRSWKAYNQFISILSSTNADRATILFDDISGNTSKKSISDLSITIVSSSTVNKSITFGGFDTGTFDSASVLKTNGVIIHTVDNELVLGRQGAITTEDYAGTTQGVIGVYSDLYQDYNDGKINTGDYFYENLIDGFDNTSENSGFAYLQFLDVLGSDYVIFDQEVNFSTNDIILFPESILNTGKFTISDPTAVSIGLTGANGTYYGYLVSENTVAETVLVPTKVWNTSDTKYIKAYKDYDTNVLTLDFVDATLTSVAETYNKEIDIVSQDSNFRQTIEIEEPTGYTVIANEILVDGARYSEIKIGDFLELDAATPSVVGEVTRKMTRILSKKQYFGDTSLTVIVCDSAIKKYTYGTNDKQTYRFTEIDDYVSVYQGISLFGFRVRAASMPDGTDSRLTEILDIIGKGTPLYNAVTDKDVIDFRYLVDSYGLGLTELSKQTLADIVGKRLDAFGILNMPSMKQFRNSSSPSFVDSEGRLLTEYIALGGDPESSPAFNYSFAEGDGTTCVGYFTPYVIVNDNGRPREVPPSAWVANTFLRKHNSAIANVTPWTIAAGITDGQVTGIAGLEYQFTGEDIENLNGMKANPIVSKRNRGRVIETENTAQKLVTSALSFIHVREVLIEIERELSDMLLTFQWKYNTPEIRAEIKLRADSICGDFVNRNGLFNFFNKIDDENNTQEIIDNQMGVLDTYVEPIKGMGVIVNNITILKTGEINSGGFL